MLLCVWLPLLAFIFGETKEAIVWFKNIDCFLHLSFQPIYLPLSIYLSFILIQLKWLCLSCSFLSIFYPFSAPLAPHKHRKYWRAQTTAMQQRPSLWKQHSAHSAQHHSSLNTYGDVGMLLKKGPTSVQQNENGN